jgi:hypothetical protein
LTHFISIIIIHYLQFLLWTNFQPLMAKMNPLFIIAFIISSLFSTVRSDSSDHRYKEGDLVPLFANKVGPFHNPR